MDKADIEFPNDLQREAMEVFFELREVPGMKKKPSTSELIDWLNPEPERLWDYRHSIELVRTIFSSRMFPLTLAGLERAMRELNK